MLPPFITNYHVNDHILQFSYRFSLNELIELKFVPSSKCCSSKFYRSQTALTSKELMFVFLLYLINLCTYLCLKYCIFFFIFPGLEIHILLDNYWSSIHYSLNSTDNNKICTNVFSRFISFLTPRSRAMKLLNIFNFLKFVCLCFSRENNTKKYHIYVSLEDRDKNNLLKICVVYLIYLSVWFSILSIENEIQTTVFLSFDSFCFVLNKKKIS